MSDVEEDYVSASQIETFELCPRKWGFRKLDGIELPPHPSAAFGTETHSQLEGWLAHGVPLNLTTEHGECAMAGLQHLPLPGTRGMAVEGEFNLLAWGHRFYGKKDVQILEGPIPLVIDHKTTRDFKWAKTAEQLAVNVQAVLYATDAMVKTGAAACDLKWIYYRTSRPYKSKLVQLRLTRRDVEPVLQRIKNIADDIRTIKRAGLRALDLPYNADACDAYGGCGYQDFCGLTPEERLRSLFMSAQQASPISDAARQELYDRITNKEAQQRGGAGINPPVPPPAAGPPGLPAGSQVSGDGAWYLPPGGSSWVAMPAAPPPPPPPAAGGTSTGRRRGRPAKTTTTATVQASAGGDGSDLSTAESMLAEAYEDLGNAFLAASEAVRRGALG